MIILLILEYNFTFKIEICQLYWDSSNFEL